LLNPDLNRTELGCLIFLCVSSILVMLFPYGNVDVIYISYTYFEFFADLLLEVRMLGLEIRQRLDER
jgi:hypothetical protein